MDWAERTYQFSFVLLSIFNAMAMTWVLLSL
jgi:hypothetical protein